MDGVVDLRDEEMEQSVFGQKSCFYCSVDTHLIHTAVQKVGIACKIEICDSLGSFFTPLDFRKLSLQICDYIEYLHVYTWQTKSCNY